MHFLADALCSHSLADVDVVQGFMDAVVKELGLHRIEGYVHSFDNGGTVYGSGISAHTLIAESHIQVHTAPERNLLQLDVHSCRDFDIGVIKSLVVQFFGVRPSPTEGWRLSLTIDH